MACYLAARGRVFDVDAFLKTTSLSVAHVWRRGEPLGSLGAGHSRQRHQYSGFDVVVSLYDRDALSHQLSEAERFLRMYARELVRLRKFRGVVEIWLDFGITWADVPMHVDCLPSSLVAAAGKIPLAIALSHYPQTAARVPRRGGKRGAVRVQRGS